jgi:hypothetical protein
MTTSQLPEVKMKLISELLTESAKITIEEAKEGKPKQYFIEGIFLQAEEPNRNKRVYPKATMAKEVQRYTEEYINKNRAVGELGHPEGPTVNLDRASHKILSLKEEGNYWIGKAKVMDTPNGRIVKSLIDEGVNLGVSSRGLGTLVEENGIKIVQNDFMLSTAADIVSDPSAQAAWVNGIMEGKEWAYNPTTGSWMVAEQAREIIKKTSTKNLAKTQAMVFEHFLKNLK